MVATTERTETTAAAAGADDSPLLRRIAARTAPVAKDATRGPAYNHPPLWFGKPDGDIVRLPGDPMSRAYYEDKGYTSLRPDEALEWEQTVRPKVLRAQRERAAIITTLRRIAVKHPGVELAGDLEITPTGELQAMLEQLRQLTGGAVAVVAGRFREEEPGDGTDADDARQVRGASTGGGDELLAKIGRAQARR